MQPINGNLPPLAAARPAWEPRPSLGLLYVWATPFLAGVAAIPDLRIGGLLYTGWMWVVLLVIGISLLGVELVFHRESRICFPWLPWAVWLAYLWTSLAWCDTIGRRNLQDAFQTSMPVFMAVVGSVFVRTEAQLRGLLRAFACTLLPLAVIAVAPHVVRSLATEAALSNRGAGLLLALIAAVLVAAYPPRLWAACAGWGACLALIAVTGSRMAGLAAMVVPALHPLRIGLWRRALVVAIPLVCMLIVFYSPAFQQRTFYRGEGGLADVAQGDVDTSGRLDAWPYIWHEAWKRPVLGAGIGSAAAFVVSVWPEVAHPHNDYLRVGFELGWVGLVLLLSVCAWQVLDLKRRMAAAAGAVRQALVGAFLCLAILAIVAATDNALVYNMLFTDPLFVLMGAAYGVLGRREAQP